MATRIETTAHLDGLIDDLLRQTDVEHASELVAEWGGIAARLPHGEVLVALVMALVTLTEHSPEPELMLAMAVRLSQRLADHMPEEIAH